MEPYITIGELKAWLRITDATDDTLLGLIVEAVTLQVDQVCGTDNLFDLPTSAVKVACMIQGARWFKRQDSPYGVLGSQEFGNYTRLLSQLDPDVMLMLAGFGERERWGTV